MEKCKIKITYNQNLSLIDLSKVIELISKGFNDVCRNYTKDQKVVSKANPKIDNVEKGSIILELFLEAFLSVAIQVTLSMIAEHIKKRFVQNNRKIKIEVKDDGIIIHIEN